MFLIVGIVFLVGLIAGIAVGAAFLLEVIVPRLRWKMRAFYAALAGGFIPMLLPLVTIAVEAGFGAEGVISMAAILVGGLIAALVIGFPCAYAFARSRDRRHGPVNPAGTFE